MPGFDEAILSTCIAIVAEMRASALDPATDLDPAERRSLTRLAEALEREAARRWSLDPGWVDVVAAEPPPDRDEAEG